MNEPALLSLPAPLRDQYVTLTRILGALPSAAVAFSGGVDSTLLLQAAASAVPGPVLAVTAVSPALPEREAEEASAFCRARGIPQVTVRADVMSVPQFRENAPDRCYHCKKMIFGALKDAAAARGVSVILEGSNTDDEGDYRPGMKAIRELGVLSPLREAGLTKAEIRALSGALGLPTASKPSMACLATRIPYGDPVTEEKLARIGRAEAFLSDLGYPGARVRLHGSLARIELPPEKIPGFFSSGDYEKTASAFGRIGFAYTAADLTGYRTGSMNEVLTEEEKHRAQN